MDDTDETTDTAEPAPEGPDPVGPSGAGTEDDEAEPVRDATCPACAASVSSADRFCEACGASLSADAAAAEEPRPADAATCPHCDAPGADVIEDYCGHCGRRWSPVREHEELVDGDLAAVTDRGVSHWRNEDAVGIAAVDGDPGGFVLVVCDGVSSSQNPHLVSQAAVDAALPVLRDAVADGADLDAALLDATAAAQEAAAAVPHDPADPVGPGASTFVAVAVRGGEACFGSVGDSRAYWIGADEVLQIGRDHSVAAELVASGRVSAGEAMRSPGAHAITRWLGRDATDPTPTVNRLDLPGPGLVLLASDGLWNYAPETEALAELVGPPGAESSRDLVRRLAAHAEAAGGADNITVAVGPYDLDQVGGQESA